MFDDLPIRVWLLIAIAATAFAPASYVYRHLAKLTLRRALTRPPGDAAWRSDARLSLSVAALLILAGLAAYIFTPAAERFASSPSFWPLVLGGLGSFCLFTVVEDLMDGDIKPLMKGDPFGPYAREGHPVRYWLSIAWNALIAGFMLWMAFVEGFPDQ